MELNMTRNLPKQKKKLTTQSYSGCSPEWPETSNKPKPKPEFTNPAINNDRWALPGLQGFSHRSAIESDHTQLQLS